jgi:TolA-binding protein
MARAARTILAVAAALFVWTGDGVRAGDAPPSAADARQLYDKGRWAESLAVWEELIASNSDDAAVVSGDAHWFASQCRVKRGENAEAVAVLNAYVKGWPKGKGIARALAGIFDVWVAAGDEAKAQAAGRRELKETPDASWSLGVLRTFVAKGWTVPKLESSYETLHRFAYTDIKWANEPDLALVLLDQIEKGSPKAEWVKSGRIAYDAGWCQKVASRYRDAIETWVKWLPRFPDSEYVPWAHLHLAECYSSIDPPDLAAAKKQLAFVMSSKDATAKCRETAEKLLTAVQSGGATVQLADGLPTRAGLGKVVLLTNFDAGDAWSKAIEKWRSARKAQVVRFKTTDVHAAIDDLRKIGAEFVAVAVQPSTVDVNFQLEILELSRELDADPMPDFQFGYLTARTPEDLAAFADRILAKDADGVKSASVASLTGDGAPIRELDALLHFGHGNPWAVVDGATAEEIANFALPKHPVVFSGACFNGVLSRSWHRSQMQMQFLPPDDVALDHLVSLAWVHAGATGLLASMEGDRGEMAMAEWAHFRETAAPLGEVIGSTYRLAFTSLDETYPGFPRYKAGVAKRMGFYDVMLRGLVARILVGDPSSRPLAAPLDPPHAAETAVWDREKAACTVTVEVLRSDQGFWQNTLARKGDGAFDDRLTARVALPEGLAGRLEDLELDVKGADGAAIQLTQTCVRHEAWGGRRYVDLQLESSDGRLGAVGTKATFRFAVK